MNTDRIIQPERRLVWFRSDLRIHDNPALFSACQPPDDGQPVEVIACFLRPEKQWQQHDWGSNKQRYTERCVQDLQQTLSSRNIPLLMLDVSDFSGQIHYLLQLCQALSVSQILACEEPELNERHRDAQLIARAGEMGIQCHFFNDQSLIPMGQLLKKDGTPYRVYSAFRKQCLNWLESHPVMTWPDVTANLSGQPVIELNASQWPLWCPESYSEDQIQQQWSASEQQLLQALDRFCAEGIQRYDTARDYPADTTSTSKLSAALACGKLSVRSCWLAARHVQSVDPQQQAASCWCDELLWREFYRHLLVLYPDLSKRQPFKPETRAIRWRHAPDDLKRWQQGKTGFPLVDAAMRQLLQTGWMHNRLRMLVAVFLSKYLLIDWREGEYWFMQHLVDADLASNNGGWQWAASTGTDAVPYFRLLSPYRQAERFDTEGKFIATFLPELADLPARKRIKPDIGAILYPEPMIDLKKSRQLAMEEFKRLSN